MSHSSVSWSLGFSAVPDSVALVLVDSVLLDEPELDARLVVSKFLVVLSVRTVDSALVELTDSVVLGELLSLVVVPEEEEEDCSVVEVASVFVVISVLVLLRSWRQVLVTMLDLQKLTKLENETVYRLSV